ncbi:MAG: hypothetical protein Q7U44_01885 [Desulfuromonadales bacterium]|nr:hypothetical protein [Desulfuromonadales bacterium]
MMKTLANLCRLLAAAVLVFGLSTTAQAELAAVGPVSAANGFPVWYEDTAGLRLELCLDQNGFCLLEVDPGLPVSFPGNFGPEAFWWDGAAVAANAGINGSLTMAMEAAFVNEGPIDGDQVAFARIRILADVPVDGSYTVTHPFGVITFPNVTVANGINVTQDIGNFVDPGPAGDYSIALGDDLTQAGTVNSAGRSIGPFLVPANAAGEALPFVHSGGNVYIALPTALHRVTGSPLGTNFFRIDGPGGIVAETPFFNLMGKVSGCTLDNAANPPIAATDIAATLLGQAVTIPVLANDTDTIVEFDANNVPTLVPGVPALGTVTIVTPPATGSAVANADGTVTYTPGDAGTATIGYTVTDFCGVVSNETTVTAVVEDLVAAKAEYRVRTGKWQISGSSTQLVDLLDAPNVITLRAGSATGPTIGIAPVDQVDGSWSYSGKSTASPGAAPQTVHVESGLDLAVPRALQLR